MGLEPFPLTGAFFSVCPRDGVHGGGDDKHIILSTNSFIIRSRFIARTEKTGYSWCLGDYKAYVAAKRHFTSSLKHNARIVGSEGLSQRQTSLGIRDQLHTLLLQLTENNHPGSRELTTHPSCVCCGLSVELVVAFT